MGGSQASPPGPLEQPCAGSPLAAQEQEILQIRLGLCKVEGYRRLVGSGLRRCERPLFDPGVHEHQGARGLLQLQGCARFFRWQVGPRLGPGLEAATSPGPALASVRLSRGATPLCLLGAAGVGLRDAGSLRSAGELRPPTLGNSDVQVQVSRQLLDVFGQQLLHVKSRRAGRILSGPLRGCLHTVR